MEVIDMDVINNKFNEIVCNYLFNVSNLQNHNHFLDKEVIDSRTRYYHCKGFPVLMVNSDNEHVVKEENFLEGCTRIFLVNPMIKMLLDAFQLNNDWFGGDTFDSAIDSPNREYEQGSYLEFIVEHKGKRIGCRYTRNSYSFAEAVIMERDAAYRLRHEEIPGFSVLSPVDEVWAIDWSGIPNEDLASICRLPTGMRSDGRDISIHDFFCELFSDTIYDLFVLTSRNAILEAQKIIALKAVPQLLPNNMLTFKDVVIASFSETAVAQRSYQFKGGSIPTSKVLSVSDIQAIDNTFFDDAYGEAIIGNSDFAKSFITSEYLFRSISEGLGIDYTAIVVGYLKSVEQLMYLLYISAFGGNASLKYWDRYQYDKKNPFDPNLPQFRYDPFEPHRKWKQMEYYHPIRTGDDAMEFGGLAQFLRYFDKIWNVSEDGKEYIFACLDDYRGSCRNAHFHKDNISFAEYDTVKRIRNNTHVLLYYLLGGFKLLDTRTSAYEQLGVTDYSFDRLFQNIWHRRRRIFWAKISGGYEGVVYYLNRTSQFVFDEAGRLKQGDLHFVTFPGVSREDAVTSELNALKDNPEYVKINSIVITRDTAIDQIVPFLPRRKR